MKRKHVWLAALLALVFVCAAGLPPVAPANASGSSIGSIGTSDTIYMVMTDRFYDGDSGNNGTLTDDYRPGDMHYYQGGDWAGLVDKLDYIKEMGFTAIWISPPQDNEKFSRSGDEAGYHGYFTHDFNDVNDHFGTTTELQTLIDEAHDRGIKVIIDAQLNHTADYLAYPSTSYSPSTYKPAAPFDDPTWYHNNPNITDFNDGYQLLNYSLGGLDDLDQSNPDTWDALLDAYDGWFDYGFDGGRIDAVLEIPTDKLQAFEGHIGKKTFGEAYTSSVDVVSGLQNYIWGMLDFPLYFGMNNVFCNNTSWSDVKGVFDQDYKYKKANQLVTFLDNHDRPRFLNNCADNYAKSRLALAFLYTVRGIPDVYYGTEQGMAGEHKYSDDIQNTVNREVMPSFSDGSATFNWVQRLNQIRKDYKSALVNGKQREIYYNSSDPVYAVSRRNDSTGDEVVGIFNKSPNPQTKTIAISQATSSWTIGTHLTDLLNTGTTVTVAEGVVANSREITVTIPGNSAMLLTNGYPAEYAPPSPTQTKIIVHYNAGFGNSISVRGDTTPLNWTWGQKAENVDANTWQYVMERPTSGTIQFKVLLNDSTWETGGNHSVTAGSTVDIYPSF
ncbi:alpha-amylase family glycosyl hydrolase [Paenibacillus cymbidii]|uniref:alpha-amylase family glycosyl hydrolase n=1 Tax=Paenibacillus cymbidii TaxID=1639034 RepID=UPI0010806FD8|nr:alpha-amylase family glycosyl hydrolase [Paenibacillus cymbidii]